jgi:putative ABC transport system permease protein
LNILLLSLGIAVITILLLFNKQLEKKLADNARGIDLVVGAKGSPLQLILCNIFHIDYPTGNIKLFEAERIARSRLVRSAIPLALGDSYESFRIVGTTIEYAELYGASLEKGRWWQKDLEVTLGANVSELAGVSVGDEFMSAHGLTTGGHAHDAHHYIVTGIMSRTNTVLDNLILTNIESVWLVHDMDIASSPADSSIMLSKLVPATTSTDSVSEITALLIRYRSALGAVQMPRIVNSQSSLQAASPAFETARLFSILGVGIDIIRGFAYLLILISALSIFIALYNSLKERRYDMAIMRAMGASRAKLMVAILGEGAVLTSLGSAIGIIMGHIVLAVFAVSFEEAERTGITGIVFYPEEWIILGGSLFLGLLCALIPAVQAYRTDIARVLASQ